MYCRNCGAELQEGQKFCPKCGTPVPRANESMTPQETQSMSGDNAGKQVVNGNSDTNISAAKTTPPKKNNTRMIIAIVSAVTIAAVVIIAVAVMRSGESSEQMAEVEEESEEIEEEKEEETGVVAVEENAEEAKVESASSDSFDNVTVSDITIEDITCDGYTFSLNGATVQGQKAGGTIRNDEDKPCTVTIDYEYEGTSYDDYGDPHTITDYTSVSYDVAANSTYTIYSVLTKDKDDHYKGPDQQTIEHTEYTGNMTYSISDYSSPTFDLLLPVDSVTNIEQGLADNSNHTQVLYTITVPNNTDVRWSSCYVHMQVFFDGVYLFDKWAHADYIKPGEDAVITYQTAAPFYYGGQSAEDTVSQFSVIITDVDYNEDTNYEEQE